MSATRKTIGKKIRFEVFKRDGFSCQYCGATPPEAFLEIDHIIAVANGGDSEIDNLISSCRDCNRGKGATPLTAVPISLAAKAEIAHERERQISAYQEILRRRSDRLEDECWNVIESLTGEARCSNQMFASVRRFVSSLGLHECLDAVMAVELAGIPRASGVRRFKYFCGVCWAKIKRGETL